MLDCVYELHICFSLMTLYFLNFLMSSCLVLLFIFKKAMFQRIVLITFAGCTSSIEKRATANPKCPAII